MACVSATTLVGVGHTDPAGVDGDASAMKGRESTEPWTHDGQDCHAILEKYAKNWQWLAYLRTRAALKLAALEKAEGERGR